MIHAIQATRPRARRVRLALLGGLLAATLTGVLAAPAMADQGHDHGGWHGHGGDRGRGPPRRYDGPRYQGYYQDPNVYYSAPPVIYQPPGASLNFSFPLYR